MAVAQAWKAATAVDVNSLNDLRETKGYAAYITRSSALYDGFQNNNVHATSTIMLTPKVIANAASVAPQNIWINVLGVTLGGFTTDFTSEAVKVAGLSFNVATSSGSGTPDLLANVTLVDQNGNVVAGPVVESAGGTITFGSSVTFPVGVMTYTLRGTVPPTVTNGKTYALSTDPATEWLGAIGATSGELLIFSDSTVSMSTMTVAGSSLTISASSNPAAPGTANFVLANVQLDATQSGEDIRVSNLPVSIAATSTALLSYLNACQVYDGTTALTTGSDTVNPTGSSVNFVFDNSITVAKGTLKTLAVQCNISSNTPNTTTYQVGVNNSNPPSAVGVTSGNMVTPTIQTGTSGTITVGTPSH